MKEKIEKLYEDLGNSIMDNPKNDVQYGFNLAVESIHSKLSHILGKSKIYTLDELLKEIQK